MVFLLDGLFNRESLAVDGMVFLPDGLFNREN